MILLSIFEKFVDMIWRGDCENPIKQESIESNDTRLRVCDCVSEERQQATALGRKKKKKNLTSCNYIMGISAII